MLPDIGQDGLLQRSGHVQVAQLQKLLPVSVVNPDSSNPDLDPAF